MKHNKETRQATALIRRQRNVDEYKETLKLTFESFCEQTSLEDPTKADFKAFKETVKAKLKCAEKEVEILTERVNLNQRF